jgi:hypothetical protein
MAEPGTELTTRDRLAPELDRIARLGQWLAASELRDPDANAKGAAAALRLYYAEQLGLPPLAAAEVSVIGGRLVVSARLLRALAVRAGYRVVAVDRSETSCTAALLIDGTGEELGRATFTIDDAQRAGLIRDRSAWKTHPGRMLWARASAFVIYDYAPDVALGVATAEEVDEEAGRRAGPAPDPVDLSVTDEQLQEAEWQAQQAAAEDAEFETVPPGPLDQEEPLPDPPPKAG